MANSIDDIGIAGWFAPENRAALEHLIAEHSIKSVIEVGSFLGLSAVWFAQRVDLVTCVDRWSEPATAESQNNLVETLRIWELPSDFFALFRDNVTRAGVWQKIRPIRGNSGDVLHKVNDADLVYIDADHSYEGCKRDIELYGPKAGKIICGDDYAERDGFGVIQAVREMLPGYQTCGQFWWCIKSLIDNARGTRSSQRPVSP